MPARAARSFLRHESVRTEIGATHRPIPATKRRARAHASQRLDGGRVGLIHDQPLLAASLIAHDHSRTTWRVFMTWRITPSSDVAK